MGTEALLIAGLAMGGYSAYKAATAKAPSPQTPGAPPAAVEGGYDPGVGKKTRKYRPAAQMFRDEDLRLGVAGKLG